MSSILGPLLFTSLLELAILTAHIILPARTTDGYVRDDKGKPLKYRLQKRPPRPRSNSPLLDRPLRHSNKAQLKGPPRGSLDEFFLGRALNPRFHVTLAGQRRVVDVKMALYIVGAVHLELNVLSCVAAHYKISLSSSALPFSPGLLLAAMLLTWFVSEYLYWENVHLYTYDIFAERIGFKLVWGCMCFYPFFYPIGIIAGVTLPLTSHHQSIVYNTFATAVFFSGWGLSRGANLQKYRFKKKQASFSSNSPPATAENESPTIAKPTQQTSKVIKSQDGTQVLYCGGLWAIARHINYVGEVLEAVGIALAVVGGQSPTTIQTSLPWLYPLYYVGLLVARERDDDARCKEKYGKLWDEYCQRVPYRLVPFVY
ncbi:ergosterol biosynthesis ERG4/ERG24 family-domain-containing protein [Coniella lustricola]|uniref:Delta(14)-sterol reductase n=1 Tax=Coniella lustricola TaxID=2025994 RepID=A0A2T3AGR4_9PEZI|nr:ergosterol biosynthesis ERG4/ERG24 family-domain-containing protein [Coniella lustricola]